MTKRLASIFFLSLALMALPAPARAAGTSFTFTNGPVICGFHPSCYVTQTSLGGWYYLYAFPPSSLTGGTVPNVYLHFNAISTANGPVSSLSGLVSATWTETTGGAKLDPSNRYSLHGTFSGSAVWGSTTTGHAYTGTTDLSYGIYYSRGGGGRGGGGAGWRFEMLSGTTTITYR